MYESISPKKAHEILDVLYRIADLNPELYDEDLTELLSAMIPHNPSRVLAIIGKYGSHFDEDLENPWQVLDILMNTTEFEKCGDKFLSTIYQLLQYPDFKQERITVMIDCILDLLHSKDKSVVISCYMMLSEFADDEIELQDVLVSDHLLDPLIAPDVIDFLLQKDCIVGPLIIKALVIHACKSSRSFYALLKIALTREGSILMAEDCEWLVKRDLQQSKKLRLLLAIMQNRHTWKVLSQKSNTTSFLSLLCQINSLEIAKLLSTILRRLLMCEDSLTIFDESNFLSKHFNMCIGLEDPVGIEVGVMCLDAFVELGFVSDMPSVIPIIRKLLNRRDKVARYCVGIVSRMAGFQECATVLQTKWFVRYFTTLKQVGGFESECKLFEHNMGIIL